MLSVFCYDNNLKNAERLNCRCLEYLQETGKEYDENECFSDVSGICSKASSHKDVSLYMLRKDMKLSSVTELIRAVNDSNYVVVVIEYTQEIFDINMPLVKPAGILLDDVEDAKLHKIIDEVYIDYERFCTDTRSEVYVFKSRGVEYNVPYCKIRLIEVQAKKIRIHTISQMYEFYESLENVMKCLPDYFLRIHRSFVVNTNFVKMVNYSEKTVVMDDGSVLFFSRTYSSNIKEYMSNSLKENLF